MSKPKIGYRLDLKSRTTGKWMEYTSLTQMSLSLKMLEALAEGLNRQGETWRIVEASSKAKSAEQYMRILRTNEPN